MGGEGLEGVRPLRTREEKREASPTWETNWDRCASPGLSHFAQDPSPCSPLQIPALCRGEESTCPSGFSAPLPVYSPTTIPTRVLNQHGPGAGVKTMAQWIPNTGGAENQRPENQLFRVEEQVLVPPLAHQAPSNRHPSQIKPQREAH